jgi:hypothetical protein
VGEHLTEDQGVESSILSFPIKERFINKIEYIYLKMVKKKGAKKVAKKATKKKISKKVVGKKQISQKSVVPVKKSNLALKLTKLTVKILLLAIILYGLVHAFIVDDAYQGFSIISLGVVIWIILKVVSYLIKK